MPDSQPISVEIISEIGNRLIKAREAAGKSVKECAAVLGVSTNNYQRMESGKIIPSLPELESIAYFLGIMLDDLLEGQAVDFKKQNATGDQLQQLVQLRHRIISASLQLARTQKNLSLKEISNLCGISSSRIKRYELTSMPIPLNNLAALCKVLEIDLSSLLDQSGLLAERKKKKEQECAFHQLPIELQNFIINPENLSFLRLAFRLKETGIENLESLATGLQQLTDKVK